MSQSDKLGQYEVIRQIAVGGLAELYLARTVGMEGFEKLVCVKRIRPQYIDNPSVVNMFLSEARLAATLHHANIAQVYDIGQDQDQFFFAMEYVHGEDLGRLVAAARDSGVAISLDCALTLVSGLCAGLHYAHEKASPEGKPLGVVHRDVSPTNVLVSYDGAVKLVDFGIARAGGEPQAPPHGLQGKIAYLSPEQARGQGPLDRRSDVFSVGSILYELTTGRRPFIDQSDAALAAQIVNRDAERPSSVAPGYPPALEAIVMRALSRDVGRRFSTALELQNQIEDFAHDHRLRVSPLVLARLMSTLFPARLEEWDHARAQGAFFVEQHVVRTLIESGKTPDAASHYVPQPLPPAVDEFSGAAQAEAPTVPAGRGSAPRLAPQSATQIGPPPVGPPMSTPPPGELGRVSAPLPVATAVSQPRLPTPLPVPGVAPLPGVRYAMPVPNMPGAVPIVAPMLAPPVASAGTLVSSALQAGTSSTPLPGAPMALPPVPAAAGDFGAGDTAARRRAAAGYASYGPPVGMGAAGQSSAGPPNHAHAIGAPVAMPSRSDARPTLMVRVPRRRWLPFAVVAGVGVVGAIAVVLAAGNGGAAAPALGGDPRSAGAATATAPTRSAAPGEPEKPGESAAVGETAVGGAATGGEAARGGSAAVGETGGGASATPAAAATGGEAGRGAGTPDEIAKRTAAAATPPAAAATPPATAATPPAGTARTVAPAAALLPAPAAAGPDAKADAARKRAGKAVVQDPRKAVKPKIRPDTRRADPKRPSKTDAKEQQWNDDSPFMPVQTPKH